MVECGILKRREGGERWNKKKGRRRELELNMDLAFFPFPELLNLRDQERGAYP